VLKANFRFGQGRAYDEILAASVLAFTHCWPRFVAYSGCFGNAKAF